MATLNPDGAVAGINNLFRAAFAADLFAVVADRSMLLITHDLRHLAPFDEIIGARTWEGCSAGNARRADGRRGLVSRHARRPTGLAGRPERGGKDG